MELPFNMKEMKKYLVLFSAVAIFLDTKAQTDEYPDYRSKKEFFTRIQEKDIRSDIATFAMGGIDESVGKDPLQTIPITAFNSNSITFSNDNIKVTIAASAFDVSKHKLSFYDPEKKFLTKIDNKPFFGDYGKVPKYVVENVSVIINRDTITIPKEALSDLANPQLSFSEGGKNKTQNKVYVSNDGRKIYIYMLKPEAGGSYEVTWVIQDKKYLRRVVDFGFLR